MFLLLGSARLRISAQTDDLSTLAPAYGELPPTFFEQHQILILIGICGTLALATLAVWKLLQPKPMFVSSPETVAREALLKLQGQPEDGKVLSEVSQVLRRYLGSVFQMPGAELTTSECHSVLLLKDKIELPLRESIYNFLRECDARKFSLADETAPFNSVGQALALVARIEQSTRRQDARATIP